MNACHQGAVQAAIKECVKSAKAICYRDIGDIAEAMPETNREVLYKWVQTGRIPAVQIPAFEAACGDIALTRALAASHGYLLVKESSSAKVPQLDLARVHCRVTAAMLAAASAQVDGTQSAEAVRAITQAIDSLAALRHSYAQGAA